MLNVKKDGKGMKTKVGRIWLTKRS